MLERKFKLFIIVLLITFTNLNSRIVDDNYLKYNPKTDKYYANDIPDFSVYKDVKIRKQRFIDFMYLIIESENNAIMKDRNKLLLLEKEKNLTTIDFKYIQNLEKVYKLSASESVSDINWTELFLRVDIIPFELAIAQAACESAWGTSYFAQEANNLFGHWTYNIGSGLVPKDREEGKTHEVSIFATVNDSIKRYINNLNTNRAYRELRRIRANKRNEGKELLGYDLADGLIHYSAKGSEYVKTIKSIIYHNKEMLGLDG